MDRRLFLFMVLAFLAFLVGCGTRDDGELTGVLGREFRTEPEPFNMVRIPRGSFTMGRNDEDVTWAHRAPIKTVTLEAFWMDITEISNNQYRQFVFYVRDSLMRRELAKIDDEFNITEDEFGNPLEPPILNWDIDIDLTDQDQYEAVQKLYYSKDYDQFEGRKEIDTRKLNYTFSWIDLRQAAQTTNRWDFERGDSGAWPEKANVFYFPMSKSIPVRKRKDFIIRDKVNVYPDTLAWISDWSYSFKAPNAKF